MVSIIISNYGGDIFLIDCIKSINAQEYRDIEVIVVSNSENARDICGNYKVNFRFMQNNGLASSYNYGAKFSKGVYLFFMNVDIVLDKDCIGNLVAEMEKDNNIFSADPMQYNKDNNIIHSKTILKKGNFFSSFVSGIQNVQMETDKVEEIPWSSAGAMLIRKNHFILLNGFDGNYFIEWEDADISWRALLMGWKCVFVPQAKLTHFVGGCSKDIRFRRLVEWNKGLLRFVIKLMPTKIIVYTLTREIIRILASISRLRFKKCLAIITSNLTIFFNILPILKERIKYQTQRFSSTTILKNFVKYR